GGAVAVDVATWSGGRGVDRDEQSRWRAGRRRSSRARSYGRRRRDGGRDDASLLEDLQGKLEPAPRRRGARRWLRAGGAGSDRAVSRLDVFAGDTRRARSRIIARA